MPKSIPLVVKRTVLATAVLSLSACSSMPPVTEITLGDVGGGIAKAGKATADVGRKTWQKTTYLLGFSDSPGDSNSNTAPSDEQLLSNNNNGVNVIPIADMPAIEGADSNRPVLVQQATAGTAQETLQLGNSDMSANGNMRSVNDDLIHEVAASETLWDIAKKTTGNANNWHVLADVNNLGQNATVFPGQKLVIPANLRKPDDNATMASSASGGSALPDGASLNELANASEPTRLAIPTPTTADLASATSDINDPPVSGNRDAESFEILDGETLWDFAKRTTGDATNWKAIAEHNMFTEKQAVTVRPGQTVFVPQQMVTDYQEAAAKAQSAAVTPVVNAVETTTAAAPVQNAIATPTERAVAVVQAAPASSTDDVLAAASTATQSTASQSIAAASTLTNRAASGLTTEGTILSSLPTAAEIQAQREQTLQLTKQSGNDVSLADETQDIKIVEATYKTEELMEPVTAPEAGVVAMDNTNTPTEIMVSGTYYPKAVYNNADFSSSLLMRVSPGTTLQVSRAMGTWFEVETDKGVGYVHQRDIQ